MSFHVCKTTYEQPTEVEVIGRRKPLAVVDKGSFYVRRRGSSKLHVSYGAELIQIPGNPDIYQLPELSFREARKLSNASFI